MKRMWAFSVLCLVGVVVQGAEFPVESDTYGVSDTEITIGTSAAFSGASRELGIELYQGAQTCFDDVNSRGGIFGRKIVMKLYDDAYSPALTIGNTISLLEEDKVFLLFNYVGTPTVTRILPLLKRDEKHSSILFCPFTGAQPQREAPYEKFVFNLRASYREETAGLVTHLVESGRKRIAVFYQADAYGRSGWDGVNRALTKFGLKRCGEASYTRGTAFTASMKEQVKIILESQPDAIISIGSYAACAAFIRDTRNAGCDAPIANLSFVGSDSLSLLLIEAGKNSGKDYTRGLINSQVVPSYADNSIPAVAEYRTLMRQYHPPPPSALVKDGYDPFEFSFVSFEGYLNAKLLIQVLQRMGPHPRRSAISTATEQIKDLELGIQAPVSFSSTEHQALHTVFYTTIRNKKLSPISDWSEWKGSAP